MARKRIRNVLLGVCCAALMSGAASAAVISTPVFTDFSTNPYSFSFGNSSSVFTFKNTGDSFFGSPVAVGTTGGAAVRTIFGSPSVDFDAPRNATPYDSSLIYTSFASPTPISYSGPPSFLGLADTTADGTRFGYAEFYQNFFVGYAYESTPGLAIQPMSIVSPVPLPASAPMFGVALLALAGLGYGVKRKKAAAAA